VSTRPLDRERVERHARQFTKFAAVGASGVVVNQLVFNATLIAWHLVTGLPLSNLGLTADYVANGLGFVVSVVTNYCLNAADVPLTVGASEFPRSPLVVAKVNLGITVAHTVFDLRGNVSQLTPSPAPVNFAFNKL
jgi:hypothetical protein